MNFKQFYDFCIRQGISKDPRGEGEVKRLLKEAAEKFEKLSGEEKEDFDSSALTNPYADSKMLNGSGDERVENILVGIDLETPELLLANTLKTSGTKIDLALAHHPEGRAYATFYQVMDMQADIMNIFGVPINVAEACTEKRMSSVSRSVHGANHTRAVDAARLLNIPFMSAHTVADNQVTAYLQELFDKEKPRYVGDILKSLKAIPEYKQAAQIGAGPTITNGGKESRAGKVFVDMTGGTEGAKELLEKLADSGVGTIVGMHMSEDHYKEAQKFHLNVVIAGHISSDNLGVNLLLDAAEKEFGKFNVIGCSGFNRIKH
jgi:hypothetical protein